MGGHPKKLKNLTKIDSSKKQTNRGFFARLGRKPKVYFLLRPGSSVLVGSKSAFEFPPSILCNNIRCL